jgi:RNA polymerase sigma-70 factor, ECF subfamily
MSDERTRGIEKDRRLVALCAAGDEASWDCFLDEYGALIYRIIGNYQRKQQEVRELFIYVIENLWSGGARRLRAWEGRSRFSTYLAAVTARLCIDYFRGRLHRERARYEPLDEDEPSLVSRAGIGRGGRAGAPRPVVQRECGEILMNCVGRLAEDERDIVTLFYWQGRRYAEIASLMKIPVGSVGKRLLSARGRIHRMLVRSGIKNIADLLE